jgi:hypothetical protein
MVINGGSCGKIVFVGIHPCVSNVDEDLSAEYRGLASSFAAAAAAAAAVVVIVVDVFSWPCLLCVL